ncbi:MAG: cohesin domain-containing protein [Dehalococcoidia bacterium]
MSRSAPILSIGFLLIALGAGACVFGASEEQDDVASQAKGKANVLRVEPKNAEIVCGSDTAEVQLYLDDLEQRASVLDPNETRGIAGFQVILRYDPAILRLGPEPRIELNGSLDSFDVDADGVTRSFFAVDDVDDYLGRALIGAVSVGGELGSPSKQEEGPDPVANGAPILLMTVHFQTIGHGSSAITITEHDEELPLNLDRSGIIDPGGEMYEPLTLQNSALLVKGGACPEAPPITPRPTPGPTATYPVEPTATPIVWNTVVAPPAPDAGRLDCPEGWVAFSDEQERYSICFPGDFGASASSLALNAAAPRSAGQTDNLISLAISWDPSPGTIYYPPNDENCKEYQGSGHLSATFVTVALGGGDIGACLSEGRLEDGMPIASIQSAIPLAKDGSPSEGYVRFDINFTSSTDLVEKQRQAEDILRTLIVNKR